MMYAVGAVISTRWPGCCWEEVRELAGGGMGKGGPQTVEERLEWKHPLAWFWSYTHAKKKKLCWADQELEGVELDGWVSPMCSQLELKGVS
jgi:hypothetical protein